MFYAEYNKQKVAEDKCPYLLIKSLRLIIPLPINKISIYDINNKLLIRSKLYSKLNKWADISYKIINIDNFKSKQILSDMNDNDESEFDC